MKKKGLALLLAMVTMVSTCFIPDYAVERNTGGVSPCYTGVSSVTSYINIEDECILVCNIDVIPFTNSSLDRVHIEGDLRTLGGKVIKSYDENLVKTTGLYTFSKRRAVSEEATYFLEYTLTCYKNGKVVDTISKTTKTATYTR